MLLEPNATAAGVVACACNDIFGYLYRAIAQRHWAVERRGGALVAFLVLTDGSARERVGQALCDDDDDVAALVAAVVTRLAPPISTDPFETGLREEILALYDELLWRDVNALRLPIVAVESTRSQP